MKNKVMLKAIGTLYIICIFCNCGGKMKTPVSAPPDVVVAQPEILDMPNLWEYPGYTQSATTVDLVARVSGVLEETGFKSGDYVKAGQLLYTIEPKPYQDDVAEAEQNVSKAEIALQLSKATYERTLEASKGNAISEIDLLQTETNYKQAQVALDNAKTQLDKARTTLSYCYIKAPISGHITKSSESVGNYVNAAGSPRPLSTIYNDEVMYVNFAIEEYRYITLKKLNKTGKYKVYVTFTDKENNNYIREGVINYISPNVELSTGTLSMRAVLPNDNMNIKDGMFVKVNLLADTVKNAIAIPESSIGSDQAGRFVYLVDDSNRVAKRHVEVGILNADNYRQIVKGMNANSRYVQSGIVKVHEGQTVNPINHNNK